MATSRVNNQILSINSEKLNLREAYNLEFAFKKHNLIYSSNFNILKFIKIKKLSNEFKKKYYNYMGKAKCKWENIADPLFNSLNDKELKYITIVCRRLFCALFEYVALVLAVLTMISLDLSKRI